MIFSGSDPLPICTNGFPCFLVLCPPGTWLWTVFILSLALALSQQAFQWVSRTNQLREVWAQHQPTHLTAPPNHLFSQNLCFLFASRTPPPFPSHPNSKPQLALRLSFNIHLATHCKFSSFFEMSWHSPPLLQSHLHPHFLAQS